MKPQDILAMFLATENDSREFMRAPILRGGWIYATNGYVAVRIPVQEGIDAKETDKIPKMESIFTDNRRDAFSPLPQLPVADKCWECDGKGYAYKCQDCDGEGEFDHGRHEYTCQECAGSGQEMDGAPENKQPCFRCNGDGDAIQPVDVGIQCFDRRYLAKLKQLPGLQFSPSADEMGAGYFTFEGGEGVIMPMRK